MFYRLDICELLIGEASYIDRDFTILMFFPHFIEIQIICLSFKTYDTYDLSNLSRSR